MTKHVHAELFEHIANGGELEDFEFKHSAHLKFQELSTDNIGWIANLPDAYEVRRKLQKWEPKGGEWYVGFNGKVYSGCSSDKSRLRAMERATKEQAEDFAKAQRTFNRLHAYVAEHVEAGDGEHDFEIYFSKHYNEWRVNLATEPTIATILMPERVAKKLAEDLNSGRVEL